jgi:HD-GYP domain-containing protein (c-di-GMP phosphodiesterase class II)
MSVSPEADPRLQTLLRSAGNRAAEPLGRRDRIAEGVGSVALLAVLALLAAGIDAGRSVDPATLLALLVAHVVAVRVRFSFGGGTASPTQPVLVAALLLLPPAAVVALVVVADALARSPDYARRRTHPDHLVLHFGDAWHAVAPALVVGIMAPGEPGLDVWPVLVAALLAQFVADTVASLTRARLALGVPPELHFRLSLRYHALDAALAPLGLLAAIAAVAAPAAILLLLPLFAVLSVLGRERERRMRGAVALSDAYRGTALLLGEMLEADDQYTGGEHSKGVVALALLVGRELGLDATEERRLEFAALLHDVGKIHVPDEILNKPGRLTEAEWAIVRRHPEDGQRMLDRVGGALSEVGEVVRSHHERWDGGGYPDGLTGTDIPLGSRIISACDAFSAMTTDRSYRPARPVAEALVELRACSGTQFDPRVVSALERVMRARDGDRVMGVGELLLQAG